METIFLILFGIPCYFLWGVLLMLGWRWFFIPVFHLEPIAYGYAICLAYFVRSFMTEGAKVSDIHAVSECDKSKQNKLKWIGLFVNGYIMPAVILLVCWILHLIVG